MRCIFCKHDSLNSHSVEHIIPESLGNTEHVLPSGVVCDKCNNYLAREVEKPFLDSLYLRERRFGAKIPNKKNKIPSITGFHLQSQTPLQFNRLLNEREMSVEAFSDWGEQQFISNLIEKKSGIFIIPIGEMPSDYVISRFICKVGLEVLAQRLLSVPGGLDEVIDNQALDELRDYVRMGSLKKTWPFSLRGIYPPDYIFKERGESFEVLHEYSIFRTPQEEYFIVVAIFGEEYVLNLGAPDIDGYLQWLRENNNKSPLYLG